MSSAGQRHAVDERSRIRGWLLALVGLALGVLATIGLSQTTLRVPDTSGEPSATMMQPVNNWRSVGQTFRAERNGLLRIEVVLAAGGPSGNEPLRFHIKETPGGDPIRTVLVPHDSIPVGDPWWFTPGRIGERWFGFDFQPIPDSAGKRLYFSLEGPGIPQGGTVNTLLFFFNRYPEGQAYVNGEPVNAHVVFRTYSRATPLQAINRVLGNLAFRRPGLLGEPLTYAALAVAYLALGMALLRTVWLTSTYANLPPHTGRMKGYDPDGQDQ